MLLRVSVGRHSRYTTTSGTHSKCCNTLPTHSLAHTLSRSRILKFYFFFFLQFYTQLHSYVLSTYIYRIYRVYFTTYRTEGVCLPCRVVPLVF